MNDVVLFIIFRNYYIYWILLKLFITKDKQKIKMGKRVPQIEDGRSINNIVDKLNELDSKWQDIRSPVMDFKEACLKAAKLD